MAERIFVCAARGGAGATTCAAALSFALAESGERTLYVDGDSECGAGLEACRLQGLSVYTLADVEKGACRVKQAVLNHPALPNLYVLPTLDCSDAHTAERAVKECAGLFDYIICDGVAPTSCNRALLVTEPYSLALNPMRKRAAYLKDCGFKNVELIVNKVNGGLVFDGAILTPQETAALARLPLAGVIPEDVTLPLGRIKKSTERAFELTAQHVAGRGDKTYGVIKPYLGVKGIIKRKLRERI